MSILSSIKSAASKVASTVKSAASTALGVLRGGTLQTATALNSLKTKTTPKPLQIYEGTPNDAVGKNNSDVIIGGKTYYNAQGGNNTDYNSLTTGGVKSPPATLSASPFSSPAPTGSPTIESASFDISPRIAADSLSAGSGPSLGLDSAGSAPANALPSTPGYSNPGPTNLAGTASALTGAYALNPATGLLEPVTEDTLAADRKKTAEDIARRIPQKENILGSEEVKAQQAEVDRRKQEVANYTASLNAVVAKQNADLLHLQEVGGKEGVTEAVYGGQQAEINREAAIKALPIQAQIAAAQGNLSLAQDHLTDLVKIKTEAVDTAYTYKKAQFDWAAQYATGEDKIKLERLTKANDRAYAAQKDNIDFAQSLATKAFENGQSNIAISLMNLIKNPGSPTFMNDLARYAKDISGGNSTKPLDILNVARYQELYPDAGVNAGDSEASANAKVAASNSPEGKTRTLVAAAKDNGNDYETVIKEIESDSSIKDKNLAKNIANEVYGRPMIKSQKNLQSSVNDLMSQVSNFLFAK